MTELFIAIAVLCLLAALTVLLSRARRSDAAGAPSYRQAQRSFYLQRVRELEAERDNGSLDESQFAALERELDRQLIGETVELAAPRRDGSRRSLLWVAAFIPALAILLYSLIGYHQEWALRQLQQEMVVSEDIDPSLWPRFEQRVENILARRPDSADYLVMMASIRRQQGDYAGAAEYYGRLAELYPDDADVLAQFAQARYLAGDRQLTEGIRQQLQRALQLNPRQATALGVLGIDAFAKGDYPGAIAYWQPLLASLPPDSSEARVISSGLAEARRLSGDPEAAPAEGGTGIAASISLAPELGTPPADSVLFVVLRAGDGNPMPLAAKRLSVAGLQWPLTVSFSDRDVIRPGASLADFDSLAVTAHISLAGTASRQQGDWIAASQALDATADTPVQVLIDRRL